MCTFIISIVTLFDVSVLFYYYQLDTQISCSFT